jgi:hypothetical protein
MGPNARCDPHPACGATAAPGSFSNLEIVQSWCVLQRGMCEEKAVGVAGCARWDAGGMTFCFVPMQRC